MLNSSLSHLVVKFRSHSLIFSLDFSKEVDLLDFGVFLPGESGLSSVISTTSLVGVEFLGSSLTLADSEFLVLFVNGDLEVGNGGDFSVSVTLKDDFFLFSEDFPIGESGGGGDLVVHHSLHGLFEMRGELIEHVEDLLLKSSVASSLSGIKGPHLHIVSLVVNVVVTNI